MLSFWHLLIMPFDFWELGNSYILLSSYFYNHHHFLAEMNIHKRVNSLTVYISFTNIISYLSAKLPNDFEEDTAETCQWRRLHLHHFLVSSDNIFKLILHFQILPHSIFLIHFICLIAIPQQCSAAASVQTVKSVRSRVTAGSAPAFRSSERAEKRKEVCSTWFSS